MNFFDNKQPLGLPKGSIRSLIAIATLSLVGILLLAGKDVPSWLVLWAGSIVNAYYEMRKNGAQ